MSRLYLIQNQRNLYLSKDGLWLAASERQHLFKTPHHDVALNTLIEANGNEAEQRLHLVTTRADTKGLPIV